MGGLTRKEHIFLHVQLDMGAGFFFKKCVSRSSGLLTTIDNHTTLEMSASPPLLSLPPALLRATLATVSWEDRCSLAATSRRARLAVAALCEKRELVAIGDVPEDEEAGESRFFGFEDEFEDAEVTRMHWSVLFPERVARFVVRRYDEKEAPLAFAFETWTSEKSGLFVGRGERKQHVLAIQHDSLGMWFTAGEPPPADEGDGSARTRASPRCVTALSRVLARGRPAVVESPSVVTRVSAVEGWQYLVDDLGEQLRSGKVVPPRASCVNSVLKLLLPEGKYITSRERGAVKRFDGEVESQVQQKFRGLFGKPKSMAGACALPLQTAAPSNGASGYYLDPANVVLAALQPWLNDERVEYYADRFAQDSLYVPTAIAVIHPLEQAPDNLFTRLAYVLDGNHKLAAAALAGRDIDVLLVQEEVGGVYERPLAWGGPDPPDPVLLASVRSEMMRMDKR
jgi:hypothetical protein